MAYPTGTLGIVLNDIDRRMISLKNYCVRTRERSAAGPIVATVIIDTFINLTGEKTALQAAAQAPGLAEYARQQKANQDLDIAAEFTAVIAAVDSVLAWIDSNFPQDANGFLLRETWGPSGPMDRTFTSAPLLNDSTCSLLRVRL